MIFLNNLYNKLDITVSQNLQQNSNKYLDIIFKIITQFGDVFAFMILGLILYLFIDKKQGYKFFLNMFLSSFIITFIKNFIKRPRPFDQNIGVNSIGKKTPGFSFPSGHTQISTVIGFSYIEKFKYQLKYYLIFSMYIFLVMLSRIYLGQHFLTDVLVGFLIASIIYFIIHHLLNIFKKDYYFGFLLSFILILYTFLDYILYKNITQEYVQICTGIFFFTLGYYLEQNYIKYKEKDNIINQIIKLLIAILGVALIYLSKKQILKSYTKEEHIAIINIIAYGAISFYVSFVLPCIFKFLFNKNYNKEVYYKDIKQKHIQKDKQIDEKYLKLLNTKENINDILIKDNIKFIKYVKKINRKK